VQNQRRSQESLIDKNLKTLWKNDGDLVAFTETKSQDLSLKPNSQRLPEPSRYRRSPTSDQMVRDSIPFKRTFEIYSFNDALPTFVPW
jgi:hypothetical protein